MNSIIVVPADDGKFKVLHNYIQHGINYSTEAQANKEANELRNKFPNKKTAWHTPNNLLPYWKIRRYNDKPYS